MQNGVMGSHDRLQLQNSNAENETKTKSEITTIKTTEKKIFD